MLTAADWPSMPRCNTERRSRSGRKISVPAISTISSASTLMSPAATRHAPKVSASAAPSATPRSLMPRVSRLTDSTQNVLSDRLRALAARRWPQALPWPYDFNVGKPCTASRKSSPKAFSERVRAWLARRSSMCTAIGPNKANSAAARNTSAVGTSQKAITAKMAKGAAAAMATCGKYWPKNVCNCSTPSTTVSMTPPVRWLANQAGPSVTMRSYSLPRSVC